MTPSDPIRVFVVDDSSFFRKLVREILEELAGVAVVGSASDGRLALEKLRTTQVDLVTLDIDMPTLDGGETLRKLLHAENPPAILVLSACDPTDDVRAQVAARPERIAFAAKPRGADQASSRRELKRLLEAYVERSRRGATPKAARAIRRTEGQAPANVVELSDAPGSGNPEVVCIGISTGGPDALRSVVPALPADFPLPILIVQHMPAAFTRSLADDLDRHSLLHVCEGRDGQALVPGSVYLAPGGRQMKVVRTGDAVAIAVVDDPPEHNCRPAVDYLFRSVAEVYGGRVVAAVMTGMGTDGADGCAILKRRGATILCQSAATCVVYGMPRAVVERGLADRIADLRDLAPTLLELARSPSAC